MKYLQNLFPWTLKFRGIDWIFLSTAILKIDDLPICDCTTIENIVESALDNVIDEIHSTTDIITSSITATINNNSSTVTEESKVVRNFPFFSVVFRFVDTSTI